MKTIYKLLLGVALSLAASAGLRAQSCTLSPGYNDYTTWTITGDTNSATITRQTQLEGTTHVTGICYATHKPSLTMFLGGHNGATQGASLSMTTYIDLPLSMSETLVPGQQDTTTVEGAVYCSHLAGNIFHSKVSMHVEVAWTNLSITSYDGYTAGLYNYHVVSNCPNTTSPDWNPTTLTSPSDYRTTPHIVGFGVMYRTGTTGPWGYTGAHFTVRDSSYPNVRPCTKNP
jgi:hypothetical protein